MLVLKLVPLNLVYLIATESDIIAAAAGAVAHQMHHLRIFPDFASVVRHQTVLQLKGGFVDLGLHEHELEVDNDLGLNL